MSNFLDIRKFKALAQEGKAPEGALVRKCPETRFEKGESANAFTFILSTDSVDRENDTISVSGWDTTNFLKGGSGPVLWAHDYSSLPVGKSSNVRVENGSLVGDVEFAGHPFAQTVRELVENGTLKSVSVGFRPKSFEINQERGGFDFKEQELLEFSIVPVPANPDAVIQLRSSCTDTTELRRWVKSAASMLEMEFVEPESTPEEKSDEVDVPADLGVVLDALDEIRERIGAVEAKISERNQETAEEKEVSSDEDTFEIELDELELTPRDGEPVEVAEDSSAPVAEIDVDVEELKALIRETAQEALRPTLKKVTQVTGKVFN